MPGTAPFRFVRNLVDTEYGGNGRPGWVRAADVDVDGDVDVVAGGGNALFVYENRGGDRFERHGNLDPTGKLGANGAVLVDVDGDGDPDAVSALFYGALGWWENPGRLGDPWPFHEIAEEEWFLHDIIAADLDGDGGFPDLITNRVNRGIEADLRIHRHLRAADGSWQRRVIEPGRDDGANNHAGLDVGDVDGDGRVDLAYSNGWYRAPAPGDPWQWHPVTDVYGLSNALLRDLSGDGRLDLLASAGHHGQGVYWFEPPEDQAAGGWRQHVIDPDLVNPECLAAADLDADGSLEVVSCDLDFERWDDEVHGLYVLEREGPATGPWRRWAVATRVFPNHLLQLADVSGDGNLDILSEATGHSVVSYYRREE